MTITDNAPATTEAPEPIRTLTFPFAELVHGIAAVLPYASTDDVTPVINAVEISPMHFIATDRYMIGRYTHAAPIHPDTESVRIPRDVAVWLSKLTAKSLGNYNEAHLSVTITADSVSVSYAYQDAPATSRTFARVAGNYPPVARLLDGWVESLDAYPLGLNAAFLARFNVSARALKTGKLSPVLRFRLGKAEHSKDAPAHFALEGTKFDGLIQPVRLGK